MKHLVKILLFIFLLFLLFDYYARGFKVSQITPKAEERSTIQNDESIDLVADILKQPFYYLSEGGQSYAFVSDDGKYVLKLFKFHRFRQALAVQLIPDIALFKSFKERHKAKREQKLVNVYEGYRLAKLLDQKESGLLFVQLALNPAPTVLIEKKGGNQVEIDLSKMPFILQRRGEELKAHLSCLLTQKDIATTKKRLDELYCLYLSEHTKGLKDQDLGIMHNIGYAEEGLFHLDPGKLAYDEEIKDKKQIQKSLKTSSAKISRWVKKHFPDYYEELKDYLDLTWN